MQECITMVEKKIYVAKDGQHFNTPRECREHELFLSRMDANVQTKQIMGKSIHIFKATSVELLSDMAEYFDNKYMVGDFTVNIEETIEEGEIDRLVNHYVAFEYWEDDVNLYCVIQTLEDLIDEISLEISDLKRMQDYLKGVVADECN